MEDESCPTRASDMNDIQCDLRHCLRRPPPYPRPQVERTGGAEKFIRLNVARYERDLALGDLTIGHEV